MRAEKPTAILIPHFLNPDSITPLNKSSSQKAAVTHEAIIIPKYCKKLLISIFAPAVENPKYCKISIKTFVKLLNPKRETKAIKKLSGKHTIIIVAHRLSTIKDVDKIYFLEKGEIIDEGTFNYLNTHNEKFKKLFLAENLEEELNQIRKND